MALEVVAPACRLRRLQRGVVAVTSPGQILVGAVGQWAVGLVGHPPHQHGVEVVAVAPACRLRRLSLGQADALVEDGADLSRAAAAVAEAVALVLACPPRRLSLGQEGEFDGAVAAGKKLEAVGRACRLRRRLESDAVACPDRPHRLEWGVVPFVYQWIGHTLYLHVQSPCFAATSAPRSLSSLLNALIHVRF